MRFHTGPEKIMENCDLSAAAPADCLGEAVGVLELFAERAGLTFNRLLARSVVSAPAGDSDESASAWFQRLIEAGECLNLRVRRVECSLDEALEFAGHGIPAAAAVAEPGGFRWLVLLGRKGRKVIFYDVRERAQRSASLRRLKRLLGGSSPEEVVSWLIGQAPLVADPRSKASGLGANHEEPTPPARLFAFLFPERKDIGAVIVFSVVVGVLALAAPVAVEALVNTVAFGRYLQPVMVLSILLFAFLAFAAAIRTLLAYIVEILQRRLFVRLVEDLAYRLPRVRQESLDGRHGPELLNRFFEIVTVQKAAAMLLLDGVALVLQTVLGMIVLAFYHPFLLGFDLFLLVVLVFIVFVLGRGAVKTAVKESKAKYAVAAWLQELARSPMAFKLHGGLALALDRADQLAVEYLESRRNHFRVLLRQVAFALGLQAVAATALLGLGGWLVIRGQLTLGQLVAAELIVMVIVGSFAKAGKHLEMWYDVLASFDKLGALFDLPLEPHDKLFHLSDISPASLTARQVSYHYPAGAEVLHEVNLHLAPGDRVALVGLPGSGKSTLVDLVCAVRRPTSGHIELDGIDLREVRPDSLREHLGVARGIEVFPGTVGENVHLHRPHLNARDVRQALSAVGLLDEILRLPEGLNSQIQAGGSPLSENQLCRLMLARAIVSRPRLLVIDGLLDRLSDRQIEEILERLADRGAPWTLLVTTHREAVRRHCSRVISLGELYDGADFNEITDCSVR
jgi:ABC-type bacteriocin/lantibiotic exporter with double-glycine peptidase domain